MYVKTVTAITVPIAKQSQPKRREDACDVGRKEGWQLLNLRTSAEAQQHQEHQQQDKELQAYKAHVVLISGNLIA
jgi:hypothetical protein